MERNLRVATAQDVSAMLEIYAPYVRETAISFEYDVPDAAAFGARLRATLPRYPWLAAERDGVVCGYAYLSAFHARAAYGWCAEPSIYVHRDCRRQGIGQRLYAALEQLARRQNLLTLNACIACTDSADEHLTNDSVAFHAQLGYQTVGKFHRCGFKFSTWYDMVWMEKQLSPHTGAPKPVVPFSALTAEEIRQCLA
ncbi:MAG: GNAT family N-acetyltransferase [Oscillospiraceae bacterium]|nr:GNAT family N-acetyltransferase [Oscillospiraceae bacterium]